MSRRSQIHLEADWAQAVRLTSPGRARVWRLYMAAALPFEQGRIWVNQVLGQDPARRRQFDAPDPARLSVSSA